MCGIVGILNLKEKRAIDKQLLKKMADVINYRGPDAEGYYIDDYCGLGHRRLSIIDLSEKGKQPMSNEDGSIWIVFNGAIYNFQEIRDELEKKGHKFNSNSDTEVIIHGYEEYGENILHQLRGMFAFAIWDSPNKKLFLARDRLGQKPLLYYKDEDKFIFASELKCLLQNESVKRDINLKSLSNYLNYGYVPAPKSIIQNVFKLLPGHYLTFVNNKINIKKYWDISFNNVINKPEDYFTKKIIKNLKDATKLRMISDVPLGAFLSGGIDSSAVVAMMSEYSDSPIKTFAIGFKEEKYNELGYAKLVAEKYDTDHKEFIVEPDAINILPKLVWHYNEPFADSSALPSYYVANLTRKYVKVALNGDAGDENFAGYHRYVQDDVLKYVNYLPKPIFTKILNPLTKHLPESRRNVLMNFLRRLKIALKIASFSREEMYIRRMLTFDDELKNEISSSKLNSLDISGKRLLLDEFEKCRTNDFINQRLFVDIKRYLPDDLLVKVDIATMANSLEARSPFLDYKFMEFNSTIPPKLKLNGSQTKYIFKKALRPYLPKKILYRNKMGFGIPLEEWFENQFNDITEDTLLSRKSIKRGYFKKDKIEKLIYDHKKKIKNNGSKLWSLLWLELWHRIYIDSSYQTAQIDINKLI